MFTFLFRIWSLGFTFYLLRSEWTSLTGVVLYSALTLLWLMPPIFIFLIESYVGRRSSPWRVFLGLGYIFCFVVNAAYMVYFLFGWLSPEDSPVAPAPVPSASAPAQAGDGTLAWTFLVGAIAPFVLGFLASDMAGGWIRQDPLLSRLPPRPGYVARIRMRQLLAKLTLLGVPVTIWFALTGRFLNSSHPFALAVILFAVILLNGLGAALVVRLFELREPWLRILCVFVLYLASTFAGLGLHAVPVVLLPVVLPVLLVVGFWALYSLLARSRPVVPLARAR